jgi:hypothetical protein
MSVGLLIIENHLSPPPAPLSTSPNLSFQERLS